MHPQGVRACRPKRHEEKRGSERASERAGKSWRERERAGARPLAPWLLLYVFAPPPGPALCNGLARSAVCSTEAPTPVLRSSFVLFSWAFPSLSFSHRHSGLIFPILAT